MASLHSSLALDSAVFHEEHCIRKLFMDERALMGDQFPQNECQRFTGAKNRSLDTMTLLVKMICLYLYLKFVTSYKDNSTKLYFFSFF